jgi:hypothetical protein
LPYDIPYPLTAEVAATPDSSLSLTVPKGWFIANDEKSPAHLLIWLINDDYTATMAVTELKTNSNVRKKIQEEGLEVLAAISLELKKAKAQVTDSVTVAAKPQTFVIGQRKFCAYEYSTDGKKTINRVVVFDTGKRYFELSMVPVPSDRAERKGMKLEELFATQQTVVKTLRW